MAKLYRHRLKIVHEILLCCSSGSVTQTVITRRCNLNCKNFHFFIDELTKKGFVSKSTRKIKKRLLVTYSCTAAGLVFLRDINTLQVQETQLEKSIGELT